MNCLAPTPIAHPSDNGFKPFSSKVVVALFAAALAGSTGCDSPPNNQQPATNYYTWDAAAQSRQCDSPKVWTKGGCVLPAVVKLNTVGYVTGRNKLATVPADAPDSSFVIRNISDQQVAFSGTLSATSINVVDTGDTVRIADFSSFDDPGTYVLEVGSFAISPTFEIGDNVYDDIFRTALLGLYGQRCGTTVKFDYAGDTFSHAVCHNDDAQFNPTFTPGMSGKQLATGGWHDAGDYGKYTVNGAFSVAFLLKAWEDFGQPLTSVNHIPNYTDPLPSILAEAKYQIDWLLKMQLTNGSVLHLVCPVTFPGDSVSPEADTVTRYFLQSSTGATAYFVGAVAMASRVFRPFDSAYSDKLLIAAQNGQAWLSANPTDIPAADGTRPNLYVSGGPYNVSSGTNSAPRTWASVELWRTTGTGDLPSIESALSSMNVSPNWDWSGPGNFALFDYASSESALRDSATVTKVQSSITTGADGLVATAQNHGYGRALGSANYYWGSNGLVARSVMNLMAAYRINSDAKYLDAATEQVDYLLGRNPFGRSMITGLGYAPPVNPHHRPSNADSVGEPWPGLLIGGPNKDANDPLSKVYPDVPVGKFWYDNTADYYTNEIAINWNGPLIYALAGFVK